MGAQHVCPERLHLNKSVISAFLKQVKLSKLTIHEPGHSSLGSGNGVFCITYGACVGGGGGDDVGGYLTCGGGFGEPARELSQQTEPLAQVVGLEINIEGLSQKAAMMLSKQKPGHLVTRGGAWAVGAGAGGPPVPPNVFSANERICENRSFPPDCDGGGGGGGCLTAGFDEGFDAIFVEGFVACTLVAGEVG